MHFQDQYRTNDPQSSNSQIPPGTPLPLKPFPIKGSSTGTPHPPVQAADSPLATTLKHVQSADTYSMKTTDEQQLVSTMAHILRQPSQPMKASEFDFHWSPAAANHNWAVLERYDLNVHAALQNQTATQMEFGSEFRSVALLEPLAGYHPLWPRLKQWLVDGATFPLRPLQEHDRMSDLKLALTRGNHKSATIAIDKVEGLLRKEVQRGWQLPLPPDKLVQLPGAIVAPLGLVSQATINDRGEVIPKDRITHDQSFNYSANNSVNSRVIPESLTPCRYGTALKRLLHYIIDVRRRHPKRRILMTKLDVKAAYRRLHAAADTAVASLVIVGVIALMGLRLLFGASPNPSIWSDLSEILCDICNQVSRCSLWNATNTPDIESPHQAQYVRPPTYLADALPISRARAMTVQVDSDDYPYTDVYLDDFISCFLDTEEAIWSGSRASLLILHLFGRPVLQHEPTTRDDLLAFDKTLAEGTPEETKIILGWEINTRLLLLSLPITKLESWTADINRLLLQKKVSYEEIATTIGRLNHAAYVIPTARAFLCHLRRLELHLQRSGKPATLDENQIGELHQWCYFLKRASLGISINLLTYRAPNIFLRADACEHGLGGLSLNSGLAWRFEIPANLRGNLSLNLLEYLASAITIVVTAHHDKIQPEDCVLSQLDSTTADYWLQKGGGQFKGAERAIHLEVSRWLSSCLLDIGACSYSQWIPGEENVIADSLSRDHHLEDITLTNMLHLFASPQMPPNFHISPLPDEINSNIILWLQKGRAPADYRLTPKRSTLAPLLAGRSSSSPSVLLATPSSTDFSLPSAHALLGPLPMPFVQPSTVATETTRWQRQQSVIPSQHYQRPLPRTTETTQSSTLRARLIEFYNSSSTATETTTRHPSASVPSP